MAQKFNARDITWLSFNERVLQEAMDPSVPLSQRVKFLGIFSNNLDEFFRVRVAGLKRTLELKAKNLEDPVYGNPQKVLDKITETVLEQQNLFNKTWNGIEEEMVSLGIYIRTPDELDEKQKNFVREYFEEEVESNVIPILLRDEMPMPYLRDKSLYLGVAMHNNEFKYEKKFAIIEVPTRIHGRFVLLPSEDGKKEVMLLEDVIVYNLPYIFSYFAYDEFRAHAFKVTKDAEFDLDNDIRTTLAEKIAKGVKSRRKGKPTRFVFDKNMDESLVNYLIKKLNLTKKDSIIPGNKIHNFKHFMDFPNVFPKAEEGKHRHSFLHPDFQNSRRVTDVILEKDVLLTFPHHTYNPVIDLLRESAMDPDVRSIYLTAYRLASNSKIINALINAVRNGKEVIVMLELRARFDEESNLEWKEKLELEGVKVLVGIPEKKVHAKLCIIKKRLGNKTVQCGFISTGNFNEKTARFYGDHMLMTSNRSIMADINRVFNLLKSPKQDPVVALAKCSELLVCPYHMREAIIKLIDTEIAEARAGRKAHMIIKVNSLSDKPLMLKMYEAAEAGVKIEMIVRGIYCAINQKTFKQKIRAISIIDEYLEHARVMYFYNQGREEVFISSADWMTRNLDHRIEAAVRIRNKVLKRELKDILDIQLKDNVKARILDKGLNNEYVAVKQQEYRSQVEILKYLEKKAKK